MLRSTTEHTTRTRQGFTLLELVVGVIILGIIASVGSFFFVTGIKGYTQTRDASDLALKAEAALERMNIELRDMDGLGTGNHVTVVTDTSITYESTALSGTRTIGRNGGLLYLQTSSGGTQYTLMDGITAFTLSVTTADLDGVTGTHEITAVNISFTSGGRIFNLQVLPRQFLYP